MSQRLTAPVATDTTPMSDISSVTGSEYTYHERLEPEIVAEVVLGWNDEEIRHPNEGESLGDAIRRLDADPLTWKLDIEIRDEDGCTMAVIPLFERDTT